MNEFDIDIEALKDSFDSFTVACSKAADAARGIAEVFEDLYDAIPDEIKEAMSEDG